MGGGNQALPDPRFQIADRWPDARLHRFAGKMVAAENQIDRHIREMLFCLEAGVDNPVMRARRKDRHTPASDADCSESFVHDHRIREKGVMAGEACLVVGDTSARAAAEEEAVADRMGSIAGGSVIDCVSTGGRESEWQRVWISPAPMR